MLESVSRNIQASTVQKLKTRGKISEHKNVCVVFDENNCEDSSFIVNHRSQIREKRKARVVVQVLFLDILHKVTFKTNNATSCNSLGIQAFRLCNLSHFSLLWSEI